MSGGAILVAGKLGGAILHFFSNKIHILGGANEPLHPLYLYVAAGLP